VQGQGYAPEAAGAALRFAHERAGIGRVIALAREDNIASRIVLGAIGMRESGRFERAGVPMLPVVAGPRETRRQIALYAGVLVPLSLLPWALHRAGVVYAVAAALLGAGFLVCVWRVLSDAQDGSGRSLSGDAPAKAAFRYSILYLFALFAALAVDHVLL
jgi:protoheme IX farnesyltransferase